MSLSPAVPLRKRWQTGGVRGNYLDTDSRIRVGGAAMEVKGRRGLLIQAGIIEAVGGTDAWDKGRGASVLERNNEETIG